MNFGPSYSKAVSLRTSRAVYCRQFGNAKSDWEVIDAETGEASTLGPAQFKALYVPDWQLPPHMRHIAEAVPSWWDWKAARGRRSFMRFLSLCSGIEAASAAWKSLGWQAVAYSEIEPFACAVLAHHYPDVPNIGDMSQVFDWRHYAGAVDLVVAGTPCQDFSVAGKRVGLAGERSALAMVFVQVLSVARPEWFVWENVPGVFSTNGGRDFGTFLRALDDIGYSCAWRVLDAQFFGVPQRRRRVFIVGHLGDWRPAAAVLFEPHCLRGNSAPRRKTRTDITQALTGRLGGGGPDDNKAQGGFYVPDIVSQAIFSKWSKGTSGPSGDEHHNLVCSPLTTRPWADHEAQHTKLVISQYGDKAAALTCEGADASPCADRGPTMIASQMQVRRLTPRECERLQGFPDDYTLIAYRGKPAADTPRYRALGNSMAVPVMRWIGERIAKVEEQRKARQERPGSGTCRESQPGDNRG